MLELDAKELAKRLRDAMDKHSPKVTQAQVADHCHVTAQAVNGWRKTGRFHKKHLIPISELTDQPLEYFIDPAYNSESPRAQAAKLGLSWLKLPATLREAVRDNLSKAQAMAESAIQPSPKTAKGPPPKGKRRGNGADDKPPFPSH